MAFNISNRLETDFRLPPRPATRLERLTTRLTSILATPTQIRGVDISHWNGEVDFPALKASGIDFVILKATEDDSWVDPKFDTYWQQAYSVNLPIMTYHFFRSNVGGAAQATHHKETLINSGFLDTVGYQSPVMWADVETSDGASVSQRQNRLVAFHQTMEALGYQSGNYSSSYLWSTLLNNMVNNYYGWVAHWTSADQPLIPTGWTKEDTKVWQYGIYDRHSWVDPFGS